MCVEFHNLKIYSTHFVNIINLKKTFELRRFDRDFAEGDYLILNEIDESHKLTGKKILVHILIIIDHYEGLLPDFCILGIKYLATFCPTPNKE